VFLHGFGPGNKPVLSSDSNRSQGRVRWIIVRFGHATFRNKSEGFPAVEAMTEGLAKCSFRDAKELLCSDK